MELNFYFAGACWNILTILMYVVFLRNNYLYGQLESENPKLLAVLWVSFVFHGVEAVLNMLVLFECCQKRICEDILLISILVLTFVSGICGVYGLYLSL